MSTRYRVQHRTTYTYDEPVSDSLGVCHLVPRELPWQQVTAYDVTVTPAPGDVHHDADYYGNLATYFQVTTPHRELDRRRDPARCRSAAPVLDRRCWRGRGRGCVRC